MSIFLSFAFLILYLYTLCPTVYTGDSALFVTSAFSLGTAHPPSYPLYCLMGKLFTLLPFGGIAYKVNLLSAASGALCSYLVFKSVYLLTKNLQSSTASAAISAILPLSWIESVKAEVYTLNSLLVMLVIYVTIKALKEGEGSSFRFQAFIAFVIGLAMGNHHTAALAGAASFLTFAIIEGKSFLKRLPVLSIFFVAGFAVYLYPYIRSVEGYSKEMLFIYADLSTPEKFINALLRRSYSSDAIDDLKGAVSGLNSWFYGIKNISVHVLFKNFGYISILSLLSLPAIVRDKRLLIFFLSLLILWMGFLSSMSIGSEVPADKDIFVISPYFLPLLYIFSIFLGMGVYYLGARLKGSILGFMTRPIYTTILFIPLVLFPENFVKANLSSYYLVYDYSKSLLQALPVKGAIVVRFSDTPVFSSFYQSRLERVRDDLLFLYEHKKGEDFYYFKCGPKWKSYMLYPEIYEREIIGKDYLDKGFSARGRLFMWEPSLFTPFSKDYRLEPYILSSYLLPKNAAVAVDTDTIYLKNFQSLNFERSVTLPSKDFFSKEIKGMFSVSIAHYAYLLEKKGDSENAELYYRFSARMSDPDSLWYFIEYFLNAGREEEAKAYAAKIKNFFGIKSIYLEKLGREF